MKTRLATTLSTLLLLAALTPTALAAKAQSAAATEPDRGPVYVDSTDLLHLESFPVQVVLQVTGSLPTPCDEPAWDVRTTDDGVEVTLWSERQPGRICATVLAPFRTGIPLGSFEAADLPVTLNGEPAGRIEVGPAPGGSAGGSGLLGGGWSFGMCAGLCIADLASDGDGAVVTGHDRARDVTLFRNAGTWTPEALARIDEAVAALAGVSLDDVYGCPDCADGGAFTLSLLRDGVESMHSMEFGAPPAELAELESIVRLAIEALRDCRSGDLVTVAADCVAWEAEGQG